MFVCPEKFSLSFLKQSLNILLKTAASLITGGAINKIPGDFSLVPVSVLLLPVIEKYNFRLNSNILLILTGV